MDMKTWKNDKSLYLVFKKCEHLHHPLRPDCWSRSRRRNKWPFKEDSKWKEEKVFTKKWILKSRIKSLFGWWTKVLHIGSWFKEEDDYSTHSKRIYLKAHQAKLRSDRGIQTDGWSTTQKTTMKNALFVNASRSIEKTVGEKMLLEKWMNISRQSYVSFVLRKWAGFGHCFAIKGTMTIFNSKKKLLVQNLKFKF